MLDKIKQIESIIEKYLAENVWNQRPHINSNDYLLILLGVNISILKNKLNSISYLNYVIKELLILMEIDFNIPTQKVALNKWLEEDYIRRNTILKVYRGLERINEHSEET